MDEAWLVEQFEADRTRLHGVAYRLLGSDGEADDAVQEAWLRLSRADTSEVENLSGWLTTVVARLCLDRLRARRSRREEPLAEDHAAIPDAADPEHEALLAESIGVAMLAVLQRLAPAERVAFVLHDVFGVPFEEIAGIVGRSPVAARQLASRGRRRVQGAPGGRAPDGRRAEEAQADLARQKAIVEAFFRASRGGDLRALLEVLDPDVALRADEAAVRMGARHGLADGGTAGCTGGGRAVRRPGPGRATRPDRRCSRHGLGHRGRAAGGVRVHAAEWEGRCNRARGGR